MRAAVLALSVCVSLLLPPGERAQSSRDGVPTEPVYGEIHYCPAYEAASD